MPDFDLDQESVSQANSLASELVEALRMLSSEGPHIELLQDLFSLRRYSESAGGIPITDVVSNIAQMATEFAVLRRLERMVPCLALEDHALIPISVSDSFGNPWGFDAPYHPFQPDEQFSMANVDQLEEAVEQNLSSFLSYRVAGIKSLKEWFDGIGETQLGGALTEAETPRRATVAPGGGLQVHVSCITPGLRIHVSPAYFINWIFFGSPSTPVSSYLLPGRYIFAGDGPMLPRLTMDRGLFSIPPTFNPALTRF